MPNEGRVEICRSGQWKSVCDNNWSENEARVVCKQLGHASTQGTEIHSYRLYSCIVNTVTEYSNRSDKASVSIDVKLQLIIHNQ